MAIYTYQRTIRCTVNALSAHKDASAGITGGSFTLTPVSGRVAAVATTPVGVRIYSGSAAASKPTLRHTVSPKPPRHTRGVLEAVGLKSGAENMVRTGTDSWYPHLFEIISMHIYSGTSIRVKERREH